MAQQAGLDLRRVQGSGPNGRIVKSDIEAAHGARPGGAAGPGRPGAAARAPRRRRNRRAPKPAAAPPAAPHKAVPNSSIRKVIARRLSESKQTIPHFYVTMDFEIDALLKLRADLNAKSPKEKGAFKLSVNDLVIKAVATTLRRYPDVNAMWTDEAILQFDDVDVSVAVATPTGLITPIIRKADKKGLSAISNEMKDLAARAKAGKLKPEEFQGGGFSISNMGMYGVQRLLGHHQPAPGRHPGGRGGRAAPGGEGRRAGHRHGDDLHALRRPPLHRRRAGGRVHAGAEGRDRGPAEPDAVGLRRPACAAALALGRWCPVARPGRLRVAGWIRATSSHATARVLAGCASGSRAGLGRRLTRRAGERLPSGAVRRGVALPGERPTAGRRASTERRAARPAHVVRLVRALAGTRSWSTAVGTGAFRALFGEPPRAFALVAETFDGEPAGFALWFYSFRTFQALPCLYVEDVFVEPAHRGAGLGRRIFAELARRALAEGCDRMEWSVLDWNAPAIGFYDRIGSRPREGWTLRVLARPALDALAAADARNSGTSLHNERRGAR